MLPTRAPSILLTLYCIFYLNFNRPAVKCYNEDLNRELSSRELHAPIC